MNYNRSSAGIRIGIIGGAGYTGGELIRILLRHPKAILAFVQSLSHAGKPLSSVHQDLIGDTDLLFTDSYSQEIDVLFLCSGHGNSLAFLEENPINPDIRIIDLSQDFRLKANRNTIQGRDFIYGLTDLYRDEIVNAYSIANPGCFATAIQLGLIPLASEGLIPANIYTTGITGSTGAGQKPTASTHFSWRADNISAYKTLKHQHIFEIKETLKSLEPLKNFNINFIPWRGDFTRGIFVSSILQCDESLEKIYDLYQTFYSKSPFTFVSKEMIYLKQVVGTNKCLVCLEKQEDKLVVHTVIDNLLKGASGQAVENMNLMFGQQQTTGLLLKAPYF